MTTPVDFFAGIIIILAVAFVVAIVPVCLFIQKLRNTIKDAREFNQELQGENAFLSLRVVSQKAAVKRLQGKATALNIALNTSVEFAADLLQEIEEHKALPLRGLTDEELVEAISKELTYRVEGYYLIDWAYGTSSDDPIWKIASKVGGASFRVVDKAKRGKLAVQS